MIRLRILVCMVATVYCGPVAAECVRMPSELSDFGTVALGDVRSKLPSDFTRAPNCFIDEEKNFADCKFIDRSGMAYTVFGDQVTRKEINTSRPPENGPLPFGLMTDDGIAQVVGKISARDDAPSLLISSVGGRISVYSGFCLINRLREVFAISFSFGADGTLDSISAYIESEAS